MRMAGKADDIATLAQKLKNVKFSQKAMKNMNDSNRYVPTEYLKDTILNWKKALDPQWSSATMHYWTIYRNWKKYNLEVLYNESTNEIWHFKYW